MSYLLKNWTYVLFILCIIAIASALIAEFVFKLIPCEMCLKQRHPYYFIITIIIIFYYFNLLKSIFFILLTKLAVIYGLFYSIWHVGIENNILKGPQSCSGTLTKTDSINNLKEQINNQAIIDCSEVIWSFAGISAATFNSILLLFIFLINSILFTQYLYDSKKN